MKHSRLNHEIDAPLEIINGWQLYSNEDLFIKTGLGHYEYNFKTKEFSYNGKPIDKFPIIEAVADWYEKDQITHHIDTSKIETALLKIDLFHKVQMDTEQTTSSFIKRLFQRARPYFDKKTLYRISTEMIIKTDERIYVKKSGRDFL